MVPDMYPEQAGSTRGGKRWDLTRWAVWCGLAVLLAALGISFLVGSSRAQERAHRAGCMSNIRHIGLAVFRYRDDHAGAYPASLAVLLHEGYLPHLWALQCPSSRRRLPEGLPADLTSASIESLNRLEADWSYVLTKEVGKTPDPDLILVYERPENHRGAGRNCFFSDGHTRWLSEDRFRQALTAQESKPRGN